MKRETREYLKQGSWLSETKEMTLPELIFRQETTYEALVLMEEQNPGDHHIQVAIDMTKNTLHCLYNLTELKEELTV